MLDLKISEMIAMQRDLQEKNQGKWAPLSPKEGRSYLLWMLEEMGEAIAIIKKRGEGAIMDEPGVREAFVEELVDVICTTSICWPVLRLMPMSFPKLS